MSIDRRSIKEEEWEQRRRDYGWVDGIARPSPPMVSPLDPYHDEAVRLGRVDGIARPNASIAPSPDPYQDENVRLGRVDGIVRPGPPVGGPPDPYHDEAVRLGRVDGVVRPNLPIAPSPDPYYQERVRLGLVDGRMRPTRAIQRADDAPQLAPALIRPATGGWITHAGHTAPDADHATQVAQNDIGAARTDATPEPTPAGRLVASADKGFLDYPDDCSHSVWEVRRDLLDPSTPYETANEMMAHFARPRSGWHQVTLDQAGDLANKGKVVIGGLADPHGHGHVQIVLPGSKLPGGYDANGHHIPEYGAKSYPRSMSGSLGSWPGAKSDGDKTVRDAWSKAAWENVTFWTPD